EVAMALYCHHTRPLLGLTPASTDRGHNNCQDIVTPPWGYAWRRERRERRDEVAERSSIKRRQWFETAHGDTIGRSRTTAAGCRKKENDMATVRRLWVVAMCLVSLGAPSLAWSQNQPSSLRLVSTVWPPFTNAAGEARLALDLVEEALKRVRATPA